MSATITEKTIGEMVAENPAAAAVLEKLGLDYCCGGRQTLEQACQAAGVSADEARQRMAEAEAARTGAPGRNWSAEPLAELTAHLRNTHHVYTRAAIERLGPLFGKVCAAHGKNHPELHEVRGVFAELAQELTLHLMKEEMALFPYVERMEEAVVEKAPVPPAPFGTVRNPIAMMSREHDGAGEALRSMRAAAGGYAAPEDGCASYRALYQALEELEADLHQHIHLENNVLFPRAVAMEQGR